MLAHCLGWSLLDDPEWAIYSPDQALAYRRVARFHTELNDADIVKCPRMGEVLSTVKLDFPEILVVFLFRDPRDVFASIMDAQRSQHPSVGTMLDNRRFGEYATPVDGFVLSYNLYALVALQASNDAQVQLVQYEQLHRSPACTIDRVIRRFNFRPVQTMSAELTTAQLGPIRNKPAGEDGIRGPGRWTTDLDFASAHRIAKHCLSLYRLLISAKASR